MLVASGQRTLKPPKTHPDVEHVGISTPDIDDRPTPALHLGIESKPASVSFARWVLAV
jgi:hypothetical protein